MSTNYPQSHFKDNLYSTQDAIYQTYAKVTNAYRRVYQAILQRLQTDVLTIDNIPDIASIETPDYVNDNIFMDVLHKSVIKFNLLSLQNLAAPGKLIEDLFRNLKSRDIEFYALMFAMYSATGYLQYWLIKNQYDIRKLKIVENIYGNIVNIMVINPFIERLIINHLLTEDKPTPDKIKRLLEEIYDSEVTLVPVYIIKRPDGLYYYIAEENVYRLFREEPRLFVPYFIPENKKIKTKYFVAINRGVLRLAYFEDFISSLLASESNITTTFDIYISNTMVTLNIVQIIIGLLVAFINIQNYFEIGVVTNIVRIPDTTIDENTLYQLLRDVINHSEDKSICLQTLAKLMIQILPQRLVELINTNLIDTYITLSSYATLVTNLDLSMFDFIAFIAIAWFNSIVMYPYKLLQSLTILTIDQIRDYVTIRDVIPIVESNKTQDSVHTDGTLNKLYRSYRLNFDYRYAIVYNSYDNTLSRNPVLTARMLLSYR